MQHVGVGDDDVARPCGPRCARRRRVAVVGAGRRCRARRSVEAVQLGAAGPARGPWSGRGRARARPGPRGSRRGRAGCSRASCPMRWASPSKRSAREGGGYGLSLMGIEGLTPRPWRAERSVGASCSGQGAWRGGSGSSSRCAAIAGRGRRGPGFARSRAPGRAGARSASGKNLNRTGVRYPSRGRCRNSLTLWKTRP